MIKEMHSIAVAQSFWIFYELESVFVLGRFNYLDE